MKLCTLAVIFTSCASLIFADAYKRQPSIDIVHYVFRVDLNDDTDDIAGEATVSVRFVTAGVSSFWLDLATPAAGKGMTVSEVTSNGAPVTYEHRDDRLTLTLTPAAKAGELRAFTVKYHGIPAKGLLFPKNKFGDRTFFSVNWPDLAHQWLPTVDHPSDKATSEFIVTAPSKYQVVANGLLQEEVDLGNGRRRTHWKRPCPSRPWLNNIGVAEFSSRNFVALKQQASQLQSWSFPADLQTTESLRSRNRCANPSSFITITSARIPTRSWPEWRRLTWAAAWSTQAKSSSASAVSAGRPGLSLVSHETAHQWFGDSVTESDWDDVWLSEGFATYFSSLTIEHYQGHDALVAQMKSTRDRIFSTEKRMPDTAVVQTKSWNGIPNQIVYQKGGWSLHMLRGEIGDDKFWAAIREYYRRYRDSNATTADFERTVEETSGVDLHWFFQQWLYRAGSPAVEAAWHYDATAKKVQLDLTQTEAGDAYRLPIEVRLTVPGVAAPKLEKVQFNQKQQHFALELLSQQPSASRGLPLADLLHS